MSMRLGHQAGAQFAWLALAHYSDLGWKEVLMGAVVASSMCADDWSPDADQGGWTAKILPGGHRGPTHMPEAVAVTLFLMWQVLAPDHAWFVLAAGAAWGSHLLLDAIFGGIPWLVPTMLGYRKRVGLGLKTGGPADRALAWCFTVGSVPLAWIALGGPIG